MALKRVQMDFEDKAYQRLLDLKARTEAASYAEVVRKALTLYDAAIAARDAGGTCHFRDCKGKSREVIIL
jgi:hypothetical protein